MDSVKAILNENETILWHSKVAKKGLIENLIIVAISVFLNILFSIILFCLNLYGANILFVSIKIEYRFAIVMLIMTFPMLISVLLFVKFLGAYIELKKKEYFITNKKEIERSIYSKVNHDYQYYCLEYDKIENILIRPLKRWKNSIAHIDFYSEFISKNTTNFSFHLREIKKGYSVSIESGISEEIMGYKLYEEYPPEEVVTPKKGRLHRFYYVKDYEKIEEILRQIVPDKVQIEKH